MNFLHVLCLFRAKESERLKYTYIFYRPIMIFRFFAIILFVLFVKDRVTAAKDLETQKTQTGPKICLRFFISAVPAARRTGPLLFILRLRLFLLAHTCFSCVQAFSSKETVVLHFS